jgi:CheY-like chemotaxis protein
MQHPVLIVDDDADFTTMIQRTLERHGEFRVHAVNDPRLALAAARRFKPAAVLLDIMMPGMDGGEVLLRLREDEELRHLPVILLTSLCSEIDGPRPTDPQDEEMNFLHKPVETEILFRAVRRAIGLPQPTAVGQRVA